MNQLDEIRQLSLRNQPLTYEQGLWLATEAPREALYEAAHEVTVACASRQFDTCSIINARSGRCSENCKWCAQSAHYHTQADVYPLVSDEECLRQARHHEALGIRRVEQLRRYGPELLEQRFGKWGRELHARAPIPS